MRAYLIAMGVRTVCFFGAVVATGWLRWTMVALAVFLPYFAVLIANAVKPRALNVSTNRPPVTPNRHLGGGGPRTTRRWTTRRWPTSAGPAG